MEDKKRPLELHVPMNSRYVKDNLEAVPYNHWKYDTEWLVYITDKDKKGAFISVEALDEAEAVKLAIYHYLTYLEI